MRITPFVLYNKLRAGFQTAFSDVARIQNQMATGKRFSKPSDDVLALSKAMDYKLSINLNEQYLRNIEEAEAHLSFTEGITNSVTSTLIRAMELTVGAVTATASADSRQQTAVEIQGIRDALQSQANSLFRGKYIFSGHMTETAAFDSSFAYQGDSGVLDVMIDRDNSVRLNFPGEALFSYKLNAEVVEQLEDGKYLHYIPDPFGGPRTTVEVRDTDDTTVLDTFSFDNFLQMTDILMTSLQDNDVTRARAILRPLQDALNAVLNVQADIGARMNKVYDQKMRLEDGTLGLKSTLSATEDADIVESVIGMSKAEVALQALRSSSARILSQSLMDYLR